VDIRSAEDKAKTPGSELVNKDHPQVVEVWNLVFIEFNRKANGSLEKLPEKHIDTGMGFERLCMVVQGVQSNYDTDVFIPLIREIETRTSTSYGSDDPTDIAIRVVADHLRAVSFSIADGQLPSNNGAGYVIRRILRRAIRYAYTFLNQKEPFIYTLVETLTLQMGSAFPELKEQQNFIQNVIKEEEQSFLKTLAQGLGMLQQLMSSSSGKELSGAKAFELYDTFGFPIDLTALILSEHGMTLNVKDFQKKWTSKKRVHVPPLKLIRKTGWSSSMMRNKNLSDMNCFQHLFGLFVTEKSPISMATYISWFSISHLFTQKVEVKSAIRAIWKHPTEM
jgi:alanyl-tRNA synthetase